MKRYKNNKVMVVNDLHLPYMDSKAWSFIKKIKDNFKPDRVIIAGDLVDFYTMSRYAKDPNHPDSLASELQRVKKDVKKLSKILPEVVLTMGNHDDRYAAAYSSAGLLHDMMLDFGSIIGAPSGWVILKSSVDFTFTVDSTREQITVAHHRGVNTSLVSQRLGRTFIAGHSHTKGQVVAYNNGLRTTFGVNSPCLISNEGSPFAYAKISNINPVRGCCLLEKGIPRLEFL